MALSLLNGADQERTAASAWYAFRFVLALIRRFGAIVKSVCVIDECVVVVELERARSTGAVGWATFSGREHTRYMLIAGASRNWCTRNSFLRAGAIGESTLVETLSEHGWPLKDRNGKPNEDYGSAGLKRWATKKFGRRGSGGSETRRPRKGRLMELGRHGMAPSTEDGSR